MRKTWYPRDEGVVLCVYFVARQEKEEFLLFNLSRLIKCNPHNKKQFNGTTKHFKITSQVHCHLSMYLKKKQHMCLPVE